MTLEQATEQKKSGEAIYFTGETYKLVSIEKLLKLLRKEQTK